MTKRTISPETVLPASVTKVDVQVAAEKNVTELFRASNQQQQQNDYQIRENNNGSVHKETSPIIPGSRSSFLYFLLKNPLFKHVDFPSGNFKNLYHQYFFRVNQNLINVYLLVLIVVNATDTILQFGYNYSIPMYITLGLFSAVKICIYILLLLIINNWTGSSERLLTVISYFLIFLHCLTVVLLQVLVKDTRMSIVHSITFTMILIYMTYVMLPMQYKACVFGGLLLTVIYVVTSVANWSTVPEIGRLVS